MREETNEIRNYAIYSDDEKHRYVLCRIWDDKKPIPLFISNSGNSLRRYPTGKETICKYSGSNGTTEY